MEKRIATLEVVLDEGTDRPEQTSSFQAVGPGKYKLFIRPNIDKAGMEAEGVKYTPERVGDLIAHELGHFVSAITNDPVDHPLYRWLAGPLAGEKKAWKHAKTIKPDLDEKFRDWALSTYERQGRNQ